MKLELTDEETLALKVVLINQGKSFKEIMAYLEKEISGEREMDYVDNQFRLLQSIWFKLRRKEEEERE
jgi:hypothetical protein